MTSTNNKVTCFGEVLWDVLPGGTVPGGAPVNVAYHLNKFGLNATVISRVGDDDDGKKLIEVFSKKAVPMHLVQKDDSLPTGKVFGKPDTDQNMHYDIVKPSAWDNIHATNEAIKAVKDSEYFVYGSLACRSQESYNSLKSLLETAKTKVCDINLRTPHYTKETVEYLLHEADILKLNDAELSILNDWFVRENETDQQLQQLSFTYNIPTIVVTLGPNGAVLLKDQKFTRQAGIEVQVADTVGSGDAFLAAFIYSTAHGAGSEEAMRLSCRVGAFIATRHGACPDYDIANIENDF